MSKPADIEEERRASRREQLLAAARGLVPRLAELCETADERRQLPEETVQTFHETGLFRVLQPQRVGGSELDYGILVDLGAAMSRGCASSAWILTSLASHHWMLAMFPPAAQEEVWGESPDALIAASFSFPAGRAHREGGGYRLSGRWPLCVGVDLCQWTMLAGIVVGPTWDEPAEYRIFLLPAADYRTIDNWRAGGLEGTGSNDVEVENAFIPASRTIAVNDLKGGDTPGAPVNPAALYRIPVFATFPYVLSGTLLGIAEGAIASFLGSARERLMNYAGVQLGDQQAVQIRIAEASASVDAAATIMRGNCAEVQRIAEAGRVPDILSKVKYRRDGAFTAGLCARAVDLLYEVAGSGVIYRRSPLQRAFKEVHAARANLTFNMDLAGSAYGRVALGQTADNPTL